MDTAILNKARNTALRALNYTTRSRSDLKGRLEKANFESAVIELVMEELESSGLVNDSAMARRWVEDRADRKLYGSQRLEKEMLQNGLSSEDVEFALSFIKPEEELARAVSVMHKKWTREQLLELEGAAKLAELRRCASFLTRRGFPYTIVRDAMALLKT